MENGYYICRKYEAMDLVDQGIKACENKEFEKAISLFDQALKESNHAKALYNRARAYSKLGQVDKALLDFETLLQWVPNDATFIGDYAVALHIAERNEEAAIQFDKALQLEPINPYRYSSRAFFKDRIGQFESAIEDYEKAIELDPEDAIAYNNKGLVEEKLGYQEHSKKSFDRSNDLTGYKPSAVPKKADSIASPQNETEAKESIFSIAKSVFTKTGFRDFIRFLHRPFKR